MTTDIARREKQQMEGLTPEQIDLVKRTIAPDASNDELALFVMQCNRTGLDPFAKQIYSIKRKTKDPVSGDWVETRQTQVSIDGARLIASRTGRYRPGKIEWCGPEGKWQDAWLAPEHPAAARASVFVDGSEVPPVTVSYEEFAQKTSSGSPTRQWASMPAHMLAKCAEMLALRRAFPQELSGLLIEEEPALAAPKQIETRMEEPLASEAQVEAVKAAMDEFCSGSDTKRDALEARILELYRTTDPAELSPAEADELLEKLKGEA